MKNVENHAPRSMSRRKFIESQGATCKNWQWSWSFINKAKRIIIFGAWDRNTDGKRTKILSEDWKESQRGKKPAFSQSLEHIRLIEEEGYQLMTFTMHWKDGKDGHPKIGGFIPKLTKRKLTKVGGDWFASDYDDTSSVILAEEISSPEKYSEGARVSVTINAYERNPKARAACVAHHGHVCAVCRFDFARAFGDLGEGFIHVHHVVPIGKIGKEYKINPIKDLIPVCPNCHAMIHRAEPPLTVDQLRQHISDLKKS
jgi:5-methylcytosine-specific restriction protein A